MANLPLIIRAAILLALLVAVALITDIFRRRNSAAEETRNDMARLEQRQRELRAQIAALEEQLAARNADFDKQAAALSEAAAQAARGDETIAALEKTLAQEKQTAADYRQTFDAQLADNDRLHADLARTVSQLTGQWQTLRAAATGEALQNDVAENPARAPQSPAHEEPPVEETPEVLDLKTEAAEIHAPPVEQTEPEAEPAFS